MDVRLGEYLLVCLTARDLNPTIATVALAFDEESTDRLQRARADHVIAPTLTGGIRMASSAGGTLLYNPGPETRLASGDVMIALGEDAQLKRLRS